MSPRLDLDAVGCQEDQLYATVPSMVQLHGCCREFLGSLPASAHNLYVKGDFTYQANYKYGLHTLDTSDPLNPVEVGMFDTSPYGTGPGFGGAWSTFPFFDSGTILVTSMQEGLFLVKKQVRPVS